MLYNAAWSTPVARLIVAISFAAGCIVGGVWLRASAVDAATKPILNQRGYSVASKFDPADYVLYVEYSWFLMGFGGLLFALCIYRWIGTNTHPA